LIDVDSADADDEKGESCIKDVIDVIDEAVGEQLYTDG
jgi:hypothetical protein